MEFDRRAVSQLLVAGGVVGLFIAGTIYIGTTYGADGHLTSEGGMVLVGSLGVFIVLLVVAGLLLERLDIGDGTGSDDDQESGQESDA